MYVDPYLATVTIFGGNFAPRGWMFCNGQSISIAENTALYSLLGTTYGGDGQVAFNLPDFRGRIAIHTGQGQGLSNYTLGQVGGNENATMTSMQVPAHTHVQLSFAASIPTSSSSTGNLATPAGNVPAVTTGFNLYSDSADGFGLGPSSSNGTTVPAGSSFPIPIISPILAMNYVICTEGIFPSRN